MSVFTAGVGREREEAVTETRGKPGRNNVMEGK